MSNTHRATKTGPAKTPDTHEILEWMVEVEILVYSRERITPGIRGCSLGTVIPGTIE